MSKVSLEKAQEWASDGTILKVKYQANGEAWPEAREVTFRNTFAIILRDGTVVEYVNVSFIAGDDDDEGGYVGGNGSGVPTDFYSLNLEKFVSCKETDWERDDGDNTVLYPQWKKLASRKPIYEHKADDFERKLIERGGYGPKPRHLVRHEVVTTGKKGK